jgi:tetratricopeptide (TPR) repeat protein
MAASAPTSYVWFDHRPWFLALVLAVVTFVAYQPTWHAGFIWDDDHYVTENRALRSLDGLGRIWVQPGTTVQYYPLVFTAFWAEYHLWKLQPLGYHLVNVLLHSVNAVLLWRLLRRLGVPNSWWAAAIFALHPVSVESVAWVTERKNVLSALFYFLAVLAYLRFRPLNGCGRGSGMQLAAYPLALMLFLCALLSKTVTCSLPAVLMLLVWWKTGRVERRDVLRLAPLFVLGVASGFMTIWMETHHVGASGAEWGLSFVQRCLVAGRALWFYAGKLFWPCHFTFIYPRWEMDASVAWPYLFPVAASAVLIALWLLRSRIGRGPLVAALCFAGTLVPALGFFDVFPFRYSFVADHFQYLACIGLISLAVSTSTAICERAGQWSRDLGKLAAAIVLLILGVSTWRQARIYQNSETLWRDTLAKNPQCWMAHHNLGVELLESGKLAEAEEHCKQSLQINPKNAEAHNTLGSVLSKGGRVSNAKGEFEQALRIRPDYYMAHNNLGNALVRLGKATDAIAHYQQALKTNPKSAEVHYGLANALLALGKATEAIGQYEQALQIKPDYAKAHNNLANVLLQAANVQEAIGHYEQALRIYPGYAEAHNNLGVALLRLGRPQEAMRHYEQALRIQPDYAEAHNNLANVLLQAGNVQEAIGHYEQAVRLQPDFADAYNNLAWLLATLAPAEGGDPVRAVSLAERACQLAGDCVAPYLDTLAAAYAAAGRFSDAIDTAQKAIELARAAGPLKLVGEYEARLELYRSGRAYSQSTGVTSPSNP